MPAEVLTARVSAVTEARAAIRRGARAAPACCVSDVRLVGCCMHAPFASAAAAGLGLRSFDHPVSRSARARAGGDRSWAVLATDHDVTQVT